MNCAKFVKTTVVDIDDALFDELKCTLVNEYVRFYLIKESTISKATLAEKLCDFFMTVDINTNKSFDKIVDRYMDDLDAIISSRITKESKPKKKPTRAKKYYDKAKEIGKTEELTLEVLLDYSRLMLCLYAEIIKNNFEDISNFEYSSKCLDLTTILDAMKKEMAAIGKKTKFNLKDPFELDRSTFVLTIIMYYYIKNNEFIGE